MKALSVSFNKKLSFGLVPKGNNEVKDEFKIRKTPSLIVIQAQHNKPSVFEGEYNFKAIHDWLNIFS